MLEAEKRGILPPDKLALLNEARKRGLVPSSAAPTTTPFQYEPVTDMRAMLSEGVRKDLTPENYQKAAQAGVDIKTGGPGQRAGSLTNDPEQRSAYYNKVLSDKYGEGNFEVRKGPESGITEYKPKGAKRWITVESFDKVPDPSKGLASGLVTAGATAGSVGGALASGGLLSTTLGTAGAGAGKVASNILGKKLGVIPEDVQSSQGAGEEMKNNAIGEAAGFTIMGGIKGVKYWFKGGRVFSEEEAKSLLMAQHRADHLINDIEQGSGMSFKPDVAQIALAPSSQIRNSKEAIHAARARGFAEGDPEAGLKLMQNQNQNKNALTGYFENLIANSRQQGIDKTKAGKDVAEAVIDPYKTSFQAAQGEVQKLPANVPEEKAGEILHASLEAAQKDYAKNVNGPAWDHYNGLIGFNPKTFTSKIQIPWDTGTKNLLKGFTAEERRMVEQVGDVAEKQRVPGIEGPKSKTRADERLRVKYDLEKANAEIEKLAEIEDPTPVQEARLNLLRNERKNMSSDLSGRLADQPSVDLKVVEQYLKNVRAALRASTTGDTAVMFDNHKFSELQKALTGMRDNYLKRNHPAVLDALEDAESKSMAGVDKFSRGLSRVMLTRDKTGGFRFSEGQSLMKLLKDKDITDLTAFADNVKANPDAKDQVNQLLLALYRRDYTKNGVPTKKLHADFLKDYGTTLKVFFDKQDMKQVSTLGGLGEQVAKEQTALKNMKLGLSNTEGELDMVSPEDFINKTMSGAFKPERMSRVIQTIKQSPYQKHIFGQWRSGVAEELSTKFIDAEGYINAGKLRTFLEGDQAKTVSQLFNTGGKGEGTRLIAGLKKLQEAAQLVSTKSIRGLDPSMQTGWTQLSRITYAPPLSREGRLVSFGQFSRRKATPERIYKLLTDPAELEYLTNQISRNKAYKAMVGGLSSYLSTNDDDY